MEEHNLDPYSEEQLVNSVQSETGIKTVNKAGNKDKYINGKMCNKNSCKKRTIKKKKSPDLSQDEEVDPESPLPDAKKQSKREKASKGKTSLTSVQDHVAEGTEHTFRTHICTECQRCFKMRSHLTEHMRLHFPDPSLQCPTCKHYFTSKSKLRIHMLRESGEKLHRCHLCEYAAVERNTLNRHVASVHGHEGETDTDKDFYTCPTCQKSFHQSQALKSHMKSHHITQNGQPLPCFHQGCTFQSIDKKLLQNHASDAHGIKAIECHHHACCALFGSKEDMETHFRTHQAFHCTQCEFSCSNKSRFQQHKRQGHAGETQLRCSFCHYNTFNPVEFEQHVGHFHANEKTHKCPECSFVTAHKRVLKRHLLVHTGEKPHKCSLCEFRCRDETYLSKHMLTHTKDKQHMCSECGYVTKWKHYLNVHMRKHTGDLRYKCNQCTYRCHRIDQLNSHKIRHQEKTLICEVCAYSCKRKTELLKHMQVKHAIGEDHQFPLFQCKFCTYTTKYRQALHNHENCKHTQTRKFHCALCSYTTFSNTALFLHKRKAHGYVPGDVKWLETYAEKERQNSSVDVIRNFYSAVEECSEGKVDSCSDSKTPNQAESANMTSDVNSQIPNCCETINGSEIASSVELQVSSVAKALGEDSNNTTEDYSVIQLTLLTETENDQRGPQENQEATSINIPLGDIPRSHNAYETPPIPNEPVSPEEDSAVSDCEEHCVITEQAQIQQNEMLTTESQTSLAQPAISSKTPLAEAVSSETLLQVMRRQDKDQAKALILEGRVQMSVVQTQDNVYRCDRCSYVTRKHAALTRHCRSSCQVMKAALQCQDCGVRFKQLRSFNTHRLRKCHALQKKKKTLSNSRDGEIAQEKFTSHNQNATRCLETAVLVTDPCEENVRTTTENRSKIVHKTPSNSSLSDSKILTIHESCDYQERDGKFSCINCSFSCSRKAAIARHSTACCRSTPKTTLTVHEVTSEVNKEQSRRDEQLEKRNAENHGDSGKQIKTSKRFYCTNCPFVCQQRRALTSHEKRGCLKPGEIQCPQCSFVARSETSLSRHILGHGKDKNHKRGKPTQLCCKLCSFSCKQERRMNQHVALKHEGIRPFRCRFCDFSTARRHRLDAHESMHTGVGRHRCEMCNQTFGTSSKLRLHRQRIHHKQATHFCSLCDYKGYNPNDISRHTLSCHTGEMSYKCSQCDYCFSSDIAFKQHCKRTHKTHCCTQCSFSCDTDTVLKDHLQSKHPHKEKEPGLHTRLDPAKCSKASLNQQCPDCPFTTSKKLSLIQHILDEHESGCDEGKMLKCDICGFSCFHQLVFDQHVRSHGGTCVYKCTECDFSTQNKQKITWHIRIHTGEKPYSCEKCSYTCADPSRLKYHMRIHQDERKYLCPECGYKCKWVNQLKYHMTKHSGTKSYACDECEYRTNRADALRVHRETRHRDTRSFICEKCGKAFKTRFLLKTHQKRHSDERPYVCSECKRGFRWPAGLRHHFLSHTNQLPFCCLYCTYRAKQKFQVVKHLRRHHPDKPMQNSVVKDPNTSSVSLQKALWLGSNNEDYTESKGVIKGEKETLTVGK